jgi:hypothetical protein
MYETRADMTNSFRKLSLLKLRGKQRMDEDIHEYLEVILAECSSIEELKGFFKPKFPKEYKPSYSYFIKFIYFFKYILNYL